jgi:hypothetical protein
LLFVSSSNLCGTHDTKNKIDTAKNKLVDFIFERFILTKIKLYSYKKWLKISIY